MKMQIVFSILCFISCFHCVHIHLFIMSVPHINRFKTIGIGGCVAMNANSSNIPSVSSAIVRLNVVVNINGKISRKKN